MFLLSVLFFWENGVEGYFGGIWQIGVDEATGFSKQFCCVGGVGKVWRVGVDEEDKLAKMEK